MYDLLGLPGVSPAQAPMRAGGGAVPNPAIVKQPVGELFLFSIQSLATQQLGLAPLLQLTHQGSRKSYCCAHSAECCSGEPLCM